MTNMNTHIFDDLLAFWFNPNNEHYWFQATSLDDKFIADKFSNLLSSFLDDKEKKINYPHPITHKHSPKLLIGSIIYFDQIMRHIARSKNEDYMAQYGEISLQYSEYILNINPFLIGYSNKEICFILLPLRHTKMLAANTNFSSNNFFQEIYKSLI